MFRNLRFNLTLWFVCLSGLVYLSAVMAGFLFFRIDINSAMDAELKELESLIVQYVRIENSLPTLESWAFVTGLRQKVGRTTARERKITDKRVAGKPWSIRTTVELFSPSGFLLEEYGPRRIPFLLSQSAISGQETSYRDEHVRWLVEVLRDEQGNPRGYLQIQLSAQARETGLNLFLLNMLKLSPAVIFSLALVGYFVAGKAVAPIESNVKLLRQFMADAGHELGNPAAIIQANAEAAEAELEDQGIKSQKLGYIISTAERMSHITKDLLLLSRTETLAFLAEKANLALDELTKSICLENAELFKAKGIEFNYSEIQPVVVFGNEDSLKRLLSNLLQNALRYTDAQGCVTVTLSTQDRTAQLSVADTGIGIPSDALPHIFDRFYRTDKSRSRAQGGSGLGLSIVKAICQQHKGSIDVTSEVGKGTQFLVTLPRVK